MTLRSWSTVMGSSSLEGSCRLRLYQRRETAPAASQRAPLRPSRLGHPLKHSPISRISRTLAAGSALVGFGVGRLGGVRLRHHTSALPLGSGGAHTPGEPRQIERLLQITRRLPQIRATLHQVNSPRRWEFPSVELQRGTKRFIRPSDPFIVTHEMPQRVLRTGIGDSQNIPQPGKAIQQERLRVGVAFEHG